MLFPDTLTLHPVLGTGTSRLFVITTQGVCFYFHPAFVLKRLYGIGAAYPDHAIILRDLRDDSLRRHAFYALTPRWEDQTWVRLSQNDWFAAYNIIKQDDFVPAEIPPEFMPPRSLLGVEGSPWECVNKLSTQGVSRTWKAVRDWMPPQNPVVTGFWLDRDWYRTRSVPSMGTPEGLELQHLAALGVGHRELLQQLLDSTALLGDYWVRPSVEAPDAPLFIPVRHEEAPTWICRLWAMEQERMSLNAKKQIESLLALYQRTPVQERHHGGRSPMSDAEALVRWGHFVGDQFNKLTILDVLPRASTKYDTALLHVANAISKRTRGAHVLAQCLCGAQVLAPIAAVTRGYVRSCGDCHSGEK